MDGVSTATLTPAAPAGGSVPTNAQNTPLFTCMACQVAFYSAEQQRTHYRSDWHRYNLKRKVADLPPVNAESFAQRVLSLQAKAVETTKRAEFSADCSVCKKTYGSENAFNNHLNSTKHKETEARMLRRMQEDEDVRAEQEAIAESIADAINVQVAGSGAEGAADALSQAAGDEQPRVLKASDFPMSDDEGESDDDISVEAEAGEPSMDVDEDAVPANAEELARRKEEREIKKQLHQATTEEEVVKLLEKKKAAAPRLSPDSDCIFCPHQSDSFESNMEHMSLAHSLFVPDLEYVVDLRGLIKYLADKVSVANVCLYCNGRGRALQSLEAVRRHMLDKGHTKIAYETEIDILEISDFYDFSSTYPDAEEQDDADMQLDLVKAGGGRQGMPSASRLEEEDGELVLPSGTRIGHRSLQRYYKQTIPSEQPEKESVVIHKMLTNYANNPEYNNQLIQCSRNRADLLARPNGQRAWNDIVTFKENRARQNFQTRVGVKANRLQIFYREQNPQ